MPILLTDSPCISLCKIDKDGRCGGCGRSKKEIKGWKSMDEEQRHDVNMRLLATQGKRVRKRLLEGLERRLAGEAKD
ncbi:MAG TPA: DUF1289 domain-containing protein [Burkholderiaceae bacterium]|nr:DUF1289 domain-containing protein [Burkholderiaceae bacterium]